MGWANIRNIHRRLGILIAGFLLAQAGAGLLMSVGKLAGVDSSEPYAAIYSAHAGWDPLGSSYRIALGLATATQVVLGCMLFAGVVRMRRRTDTPSPPHDHPPAVEKEAREDAPSFAADIRPLFRARDIESMKRYGMDLSSYEDVKRHAKDIYATLCRKTMPCDRPWSDDQTGRFRDWMERGMKT